MRFLVILLSGVLFAGCGKTPESAKRDGAAAVATAPAATSQAPQSPEAGQGSTKPGQTQRETPEGRQNIRNVNLAQFLEKHLAELNPDLAHIATECGEDQKPIRRLVTEKYGDLDGDGQEEVLVQGYSCMSGTYGEDFYGVLKLLADGKIEVLPIREDRPKVFKDRSPDEGLRGKLVWSIDNNLLVEQYPVYAEDDPNSSPSRGIRKFIYRWDGHQFVLDDMIDVPPEKRGS